MRARPHSPRSGLLVFLLLLSWAAPDVRAQSLKDTLAQQALDRSLAREADYTSKRCATPLVARLGSPAAGTPAPDPAQILGQCDAVLGALETYCARGEAERASVAAQIREVVCRPGTPRGAGLEKGVLLFVPGDGEGGYRFALDFLTEALGARKIDRAGTDGSP